LTLTNCAFRNNQGQDGGVIRCYGDTTPQTTSLVLTGCLFDGNSSATDGGALYLYKTATATITACTFRANTAAGDGGAIRNYQASPTIVSCLFAGNTATGNGGAVQNLSGSAPSLLNCTLVANTAGKGGAVAALGGGNPSVSNSILWDNTATQGASVYLGTWQWGNPQTATATVKFSDVQGGRNSAFTDPGCTLTWDSASNIDRDPLFAASGTGDYHLTADSPCLDAGDPAYTPGSGVTDLDGHPRSQGAAVDLGAYELSLWFTLTVHNGSGSGVYWKGHVQAISADPAPSGQRFGWWTGDTRYVANVCAASTTVTMPTADVTLTATYMAENPSGLLFDWNGDGVISIIGDVPLFVQCVYFGNCPDGVDPIAAGDCNHDGILSIIGDVPCFVDCVYFQKGCPQ
jgi:predicted outer membrane repeat protein